MITASPGHRSQQASPRTFAPRSAPQHRPPPSGRSLEPLFPPFLIKMHEKRGKFSMFLLKITEMNRTTHLSQQSPRQSNAARRRSAPVRGAATTRSEVIAISHTRIHHTQSVSKGPGQASQPTTNGRIALGLHVRIARTLPCLSCAQIELYLLRPRRLTINGPQKQRSIEGYLYFSYGAAMPKLTSATWKRAVLPVIKKSHANAKPL